MQGNCNWWKKCFNIKKNNFLHYHLCVPYPWITDLFHDISYSMKSDCNKIWRFWQNNTVWTEVEYFQNWIPSEIELVGLKVSSWTVFLTAQNQNCRLILMKVNCSLQSDRPRSLISRTQRHNNCTVPRQSKVMPATPLLSIFIPATQCRIRSQGQE